MPGPPQLELRIALLGGFHVTVGGVAVGEAAWRLRKARSLIKLLALAPEHALHREHVVEALWPDRAADTISNNLRQTLFVARRALESGPAGATVLLRHELLSLEADRIEVDVTSFEAAADRAERAASIEHHRAAVELYTGELLPEDRFEAWAGARREALRERHVGLLVELATMYERDGDLVAATTTLQQAVLEEPHHEHAHRELMRIFARTGRRQRALAQFHLLRETLRRDFEDEPDAQTKTLYQDILTRRLDDAPAEVAPAKLAPAELTPAGRAPQAPGAALAPEPASAPAFRHPGPATGALHNLPLALTSFVGRERALREVIGLIGRHRLVTLTGPGGCGKTRLAIEAGTALRRSAADGVWLVELAGLSDSAWLAQTVASVLGVENRGERSSQEAVAIHIGAREMLIVLDNCEHVVDECARLATGLLTRCPALRVLATSRESLHVTGEVNWRVPSLSSDEAERLFSERAATVSSRYTPSPETAEAVAEICRRVDGIPLAVELAAARIGVLAPAQIAARLRESLSVLTADRRPALTRQQTLNATLDWSHDLLDPEERALFRALGVFAGDCDLDAIEAVCKGELDVLGRLVDKSLVVVEELHDSARYRLLDTIRHYARARLAEAGEAARLQERHCRHYLGLAERLAPELAQGQCREQLEREVDELRLALGTALRTDADLALRLAGASWRFWHDRGDRTEGARWLSEALQASPAPSPWRATALEGLSVLALRTSNHERSLAAGAEAVALRRGLGDRPALAEALHHLGTLTWVFSDRTSAEYWCRESLGVARASEPGIAASVAHTLGVIAASRDDTAAGAELIAQSIEDLRRLPTSATPLLLPVALGFGRYPGGVADRLFLDQTFVTARRVRPGVAVAYALCDRAVVARNAGELGSAREFLEDSLATFRRHRDHLGAAHAMALLGVLVATSGEPELARELLEESLTIREAANEARGIGLSRLAIGAAAAGAGDGLRARGQVKLALELFERIDDRPGRSSAVMQLGYLAADAGRLLQARELQQRALADWRRFAPSTLWCASALMELARIDVALGQPRRAEEQLEMACEVCLHNDDRPRLRRCRQAIDALGNSALTPD